VVSISLGATRELGKLREGLEEKKKSDGFFWFEVEKWLKKDGGAQLVFNGVFWDVVFLMCYFLCFT